MSLPMIARKVDSLSYKQKAIEDQLVVECKDSRYKLDEIRKEVIADIECLNSEDEGYDFMVKLVTWFQEMEEYQMSLSKDADWKGDRVLLNGLLRSFKTAVTQQHLYPDTCQRYLGDLQAKIAAVAPMVERKQNGPQYLQHIQAQMAQLQEKLATRMKWVSLGAVVSTYQSQLHWVKMEHKSRDTGRTRTSIETCLAKVLAEKEKLESSELGRGFLEYVFAELDEFKMAAERFDKASALRSAVNQLSFKHHWYHNYEAQKHQSKMDECWQDMQEPASILLQPDNYGMRIAQVALHKFYFPLKQKIMKEAIPEPLVKLTPPDFSLEALKPNALANRPASSPSLTSSGYTIPAVPNVTPRQTSQPLLQMSSSPSRAQSSHTTTLQMSSTSSQSPRNTLQMSSSPAPAPHSPHTQPHQPHAAHSPAPYSQQPANRGPPNSYSAPAPAHHASAPQSSSSGHKLLEMSSSPSTHQYAPQHNTSMSSSPHTQPHQPHSAHSPGPYNSPAPYNHQGGHQPSSSYGQPSPHHTQHQPAHAPAHPPGQYYGAHNPSPVPDYGHGHHDAGYGAPPMSYGELPLQFGQPNPYPSWNPNDNYAQPPVEYGHYPPAPAHQPNYGHYGDVPASPYNTNSYRDTSYGHYSNPPNPYSQQDTNYASLPAAQHRGSYSAGSFPPANTGYPTLPQQPNYSAGAIPSSPSLPRSASAPILVLADFNGQKRKLAVDAKQIDDLVRLVYEKLEIKDTAGSMIEYEDEKDFPGSFFPIKDLPVPLPEKLHLRVQSSAPAAVPAYMMSNRAPDTAMRADSVSQLNFSIPIGELEFGAVLGQGSFGKVYSGWWRSQQVAIKESLITEPVAKAEFISEAKLTISIRPHRNVVQVLGISSDSPDGRVYIVMDIMTKSLDKLAYDQAERPKISSRQIHEYALGIAAGLTHLHAEGIVHRDLACRNILISTDGIVKISDFGMSRRVDAGAPSQTHSNTGPIFMMAPENFYKHYSTQSDVWSYGCLLFELVAGHRPHPEKDLLDAALSIRDNGANPGVPPGTDPLLGEIMQSCWQVEPSKRPSMAEIATKLRQAPPR